MADQYMVGLGSNIPKASLTVIKPQPRSKGVQYMVQEYTTSGSFRDAPYLELEWNVLGSADLYRDVLGLFSLEFSSQAIVTVWARNEVFTWTRYSGTAMQPPPNWDRAFPRDITILIRGLKRLDL